MSLFDDSSVIEEVLGSPGRIRVLRTLLMYGELNISRLVRETGMHYRLVNKHIEVLKRYGIVVEKRFGRARVVAVNRGNPLVEKLAELFAGGGSGRETRDGRHNG